MGGQGEDSMENEAERPKFDLWLPRCLFGFFLGIQKEARRRCGEIPQARHRKCQFSRSA